MAPNADCQSAAIYRPRKPQESPVYKVVSQYFDEFERIYPEQFEKSYGFWRPIIRESIEKYLTFLGLPHAMPYQMGGSYQICF